MASSPRTFPALGSQEHQVADALYVAPKVETPRVALTKVAAVLGRERDDYAAAGRMPPWHPDSRPSRPRRGKRRFEPQAV